MRENPSSSSGKGSAPGPPSNSATFRRWWKSVLWHLGQRPGQPSSSMSWFMALSWCRSGKPAPPLLGADPRRRQTYAGLRLLGLVFAPFFGGFRAVGGNRRALGGLVVLAAGGLARPEELDAVGDDLDLRAGIAVLADPASLLQGSDDEDHPPLLQELRAELGEAAPDRHVDEADGLARLEVVLLHLPVHRERHPQVGNAAGIRVLELRIARETPHDDRQAVVVHRLRPPCRPRCAVNGRDIARGVPSGRRGT